MAMNVLVQKIQLKSRKARPLTDKWTFSTNGVSIMNVMAFHALASVLGAEAKKHMHLTKLHGNKIL